MSVPRLEVRRAIRLALAELPPTARVLAACSGGADSLALAAAAAHEARRTGRPTGAVTVDHGLQDGSARRARAVAARLIALGLDPVEIVHVRVDGGDGPEGNARRLRYAALDAVARRHDAAAVLLGHTLDDQAETVLLGLARGSGARSLSGMAEHSGRYRRPLLRLDRRLVRQSVPAELPPWEDPHNDDPTFSRVRVRHTVLPVLEEQLGPGTAAALARSATLLRADADALDALAGDAFASLCEVTRGPDRSSGDDGDSDGGDSDGGSRDGGSRDEPGVVTGAVPALLGLAPAVRWRVLRRAAVVAGCPPTDLTAAHVAAVDALLTDWHGQVGIDLPGSVRAVRRSGVLRLGRLPAPR